jgi:hypothetical protein
MNLMLSMPTPPLKASLLSAPSVAPLKGARTSLDRRDQAVSNRLASYQGKPILALGIEHGSCHVVNYVIRTVDR